MATRTSADLPVVVQSSPEIRRRIAAERQAGRTIGLVPTMGALHAGHASLVRASQSACDVSAVTIFVNPAQFGPHEDLAKYPRALATDLQILAELGVELVFVPSVEEMYPEGFSTFVAPPAVAQRWEGEFRPGHFRGVATVVLKLFHLIPADIAFFGEKDYQQGLVIQRMVQDLGLPVSVRMCPIVREEDGLALSSRNRFLTPEDRRRALSLSRGLQQARQLFAAGERNAERLAEEMHGVLARAGIADVDYAVIVHPETLEPVAEAEASSRALIAAHVRDTRLIDNSRLS